MTLLAPYIPLAPKIPIESGSNSNLEPPPPVRTSDRYEDAFEAEAGKIMHCEMQEGSRGSQMAWITFNNPKAARWHNDTYITAPIRG